MCARIQQLEADVLASVFSAGLRKGKENVVVDELRELQEARRECQTALWDEIARGRAALQREVSTGAARARERQAEHAVELNNLKAMHAEELERLRADADAQLRQALQDAAAERATQLEEAQAAAQRHSAAVAAEAHATVAAATRELDEKARARVKLTVDEVERAYGERVAQQEREAASACQGARML